MDRKLCEVWVRCTHKLIVCTYAHNSVTGDLTFWYSAQYPFTWVSKLFHIFRYFFLPSTHRWKFLTDPIFSQPKPLSLRTTLIFFSPAIAFLELKEFLPVLPAALIGSLEMNFFISLDLSWKPFSCLWKHPFCIIGTTRVILLLGKRKRGRKFSNNFVQVRSQSFFHFLLSLAWHV